MKFGHMGGREVALPVAGYLLLFTNIAVMVCPS